MTSLEQLQALPSSLQKFRLMLKEPLQEPTPLQLEHLTQLKSFYFEERVLGLPAGSVLPSSLTGLSVLGPVSAVQGARSLQHLLLDNGAHAVEFLQALPSISSLRSLQAGLQGATKDHVKLLLGAVAEVTQLTHLALFPNYRGFDRGQHIVGTDGLPALGEAVQLHKHLQKLPQLKNLVVYQLDVQPSDAMGFTCLTGLTSLNLSNCLHLEDSAAVAAAGRLTRLRRLTLDANGLSDKALCPAVACLTGLEHLTIGRDAPKLTDDSLHLLSPLTNLTCLGVDCRGVSDAALRRFLQGMPQLESSLGKACGISNGRS